MNLISWENSGPPSSFFFSFIFCFYKKLNAFFSSSPSPSYCSIYLIFLSNILKLSNMSVTTEQQHNHHQHSLINWLTHVTHKHNHHHHNDSSKSHFQFPAIKQGKETAFDKKQPLTCCNTLKHNTNDPGSSHHISLFHRHTPSHTKIYSHHHSDSSSEEQPECKCCERSRRPSSVNDADDEMSSIISMKAEKNNKATPITTSKMNPYTNNAKEERRKSFFGIDSNKSSFSTINSDAVQERHREKSIYTLPQDINDPNEGFKLLKEDGGLIDYDSSGFEADDEDSSEITKVTYNSTKVIIKNDLVKLALNG
jgi:hypothetical protein